MWKEGEKDSRNDEQRASRKGWEMMFGDDGDCFLFRKKHPNWPFHLMCNCNSKWIESVTQFTGYPI